MLIIFGEVKAGKSALGNFVSGYYLEGTEFENYNTKPQFYVYDSTEQKLLNSDHFKEDEIEATSAIQYFTLLNGLTWVDTPGIHSLTIENQELAMEYIKYADLILFVTSSNNPCKQDENQEISRLIKLDKPLLITITKSDNQTLELVNGETTPVIKPKSIKIRKEQEDYVADIINEMGKGNNNLSKNQYVSISTKLAIKALESKDEKMFEESNLPSFYSLISNVISEKALELKMKRPKDELNFVIQELIEGIQSSNICGINQMKQNIQSILDAIEKQKQILDKVKSEILNEVKTQLITNISDIMYQAKIDGTIKEENYIMDKISNSLHESIEKQIKEKISAVLTDFRNYTIESHSIHTDIGYKKKYGSIEYPIYEIRTSRRDPKGFLETIGSILLGIEFTETKTVKRSLRKEIVVGDNFNEIVQRVWNELEVEAGSIVNLEVDRVKKEYFYELQNRFEEIFNALTQFKNELLNLKF